MYISPDRAAGGNPVVPDGNVRFRGPLSVVFKTPEMHIPPWYWFRNGSAKVAMLYQLETPKHLIQYWAFSQALGFVA